MLRYPPKRGGAARVVVARAGEEAAAAEALRRAGFVLGRDALLLGATAEAGQHVQSASADWRAGGLCYGSPPRPPGTTSFGPGLLKRTAEERRSAAAAQTLLE